MSPTAEPVGVCSCRTCNAETYDDPSAPWIVCDYCNTELHRDRNGWWVGTDETSDCPYDNRGHAVAGEPR